MLCAFPIRTCVNFGNFGGLELRYLWVDFCKKDIKMILTACRLEVSNEIELRRIHNSYKHINMITAKMA